ncbi:MAG TPA: hypothetical protein EYP07_13285 [Kiloniellaceae bacterium]|nr:hypothetical protein [Kiloniellaceae bacterium]
MPNKNLVAAKSIKLGGVFFQPGEEVGEEAQKAAGVEGMKAAAEAGCVMTRKDYDASQMNDATKETLDQARERAARAEARVAELEEALEARDAEIAALKDDAPGGGDNEGAGEGGLNV